MTAQDIIIKYIDFFEKRGHKRIANSPLVPENDPTTLFTSSGMQPLIPYLLGESHPQGKRLVDVQNCFRAVDIDEVGDNRHTTFFRMLGNWSLGDYFKKEEIPWLWEFLTKELGLPKEKLYITIFEGFESIPRDNEAFEIWKGILTEEKIDADERISYYGVNQNWWSRSGPPDKMPVGEIGGPDTEVFYDFGTPHDKKFGEKCHPNCQCGRFMEISNSVFIQYQKTDDGFKELPQKNVDYGGGVERLLAAVQDKSDMFETSLFAPIIKAIEKETGEPYHGNEGKMRITADHLRASVYLLDAKVSPSNKDRGYILRRLIRRALDNLGEGNVGNVISAIVEEGNKTDPGLSEKIESIKKVIADEKGSYEDTIQRAEKTVSRDTKSLTPEEAFKMFTTHGLSPSQIKNRGYVFDEEAFDKLMIAHKDVSRAGGTKKFAGGLADASEATVRGHTATHLLHQAIRDLLGNEVHQIGSNITAERVRFDFNYDKPLTSEELESLEETVNEKIKENLPVRFEMLPLERAKEIGAIGLFDEKYAELVKVYFIGDYSKEFCGGPHVSFTSEIKSFKIIKQENLGKGQKRLYAKVG